MTLALEWKPFKKQEEFLRIPTSIFEGFYGGAAAGGKSEVLLMDPLTKDLLKEPQFHGIIFRRTFPELKESLIKRSHNWYPKLGGRYSSNDHEWKFPSGAAIRFSYLEHDKDARSHDTAEYNYCAFDELTAFTEYQYRYLMSRVRSSTNLPAYVRSASNPGGPGHSWVKKRFIVPCPEGTKIIQDLRTGNRRIFIKAMLSDNPIIMNKDPGYARRLELLPEAEKKAKLYGDWDVFMGQVFTEFRGIRLPDEPENALHVIDPIELPAWWPRVLAIDWGFTARTAAYWGALSPLGRVYVYREYYEKEKTVTQWASDIARLSAEDPNIKIVYLDPSAWQNRGDIKNIAEQFHEVSGFTPVRADNDRLGGKALFHDMLRWQPRPPKRIPKEGYDAGKAEMIMRQYGLKAMQEYQQAFVPEPPELNIPRLQIFSTCPALIECIPSLVYSESRTEDVADGKGDDPYDGSRYLIKGIQQYFREVQGKASEFARQQPILDEFQRTGDYTKLARQMERLEADRTAFHTPVFPAGRATSLSSFGRAGRRSRFRTRRRYHNTL